MIPENFRGRATRVTLAGFQAAAKANQIDLANLLAVWSVECGGDPFTADGRPVILFEAHWFSRLTGGRFDRSHPTLSSRAWDRSLYRSTRAGEYERLQAAMNLDRTAALQAASWGGCQILGVNFALAGFADVDAMIAAMCEGERFHLTAFLSFCEARGLMGAIRSGDFDAFGRGYNGTSYKLNRYGDRLREAKQRISQSLADGVLGPGDCGEAVRQVQIDLRAAGFAIVADGVYGPMTARAVDAFRGKVNLPPGTTVDASVISALGKIHV